MRNRRHTKGIFIHLGLLLPTALVAQQVVVVPAGANIDNYITSAQPGSILVLTPGGYGQMALDKGLTIVGYGSTVGIGFSTNIPSGQKASVIGLTVTSTYPYIPSGYVDFLGGDVAISDVTIQNIRNVTVWGGEVTMQHVTGIVTGLSIMSGTCMVTNCAFSGSDAYDNYQYGAFPGIPGLKQTGGTLMVSGSTFQGGAVGIASHFPAPPSNLAGGEGWLKSGGNAFAADCTFVGGGGNVSNPGAVAIASNGSLSIARSTTTNGAAAAAASSGYQPDPRLVGIAIDAHPQRGNQFTVTATAGSSLEVMAILGGFSRGMTNTQPFAEPLFGTPTQLTALTLAQPAAGAAVTYSVAVPNVASLQGAEIWFQGLQLAGAVIQTSPAVGGAIR